MTGYISLSSFLIQIFHPWPKECPCVRTYLPASASLQDSCRSHFWLVQSPEASPRSLTGAFSFLKIFSAHSPILLDTQEYLRAFFEAPIMSAPTNVAALSTYSVSRCFYCFWNNAGETFYFTSHPKRSSESNQIDILSDSPRSCKFGQNINCILR